MEQVAKKSSLKERLLEEERLFQETGHMHGLKDLPLKEQDPITYEIVYDALSTATVAAYGLAARVSFSPVLREAGDGMFSLQAPTGNVVCTSSGIVYQTVLPGEGIKWAIRDGVEDDPGIEPGDIFEQSFPLISASHPADAHDSIPIFWEGELVAWASGVVHRLDAGAFVYGQFHCSHDNYFGDGMQLLFEKIGKNNQFTREYRRRAEAFSRMPAYFMADAAACVAGATVIRDRVIEIVKRYGVDYFKEVLKEFIEDGRRMTLSKIRNQLVPGRYRKRGQRTFNLSGKEALFPYQKKDWSFMVATEFQIDRTGDMYWNYDGSSRALPFGLNGGAKFHEITGAIVLINMINYDRNNSGSLSVLKLAAPPPPGSWTNPAAAYHWPSCNSSMAFNYASACELVGRGFYARGFVEETLAGAPEVGSLEFAGINATGMHVAGMVDTALGPGLPAQALRDGPEAGGYPMVSNSDLGNVEVLELVYPVSWLGRRLRIDGMGKGKYRGGATPTAVYLMRYADGCYQRPAGGAEWYVPFNDAVFGAYPGPVGIGVRLDADEVKAHIRDRLPLIHGPGDPSNPDYIKAGFEKVRHEKGPVAVPEPLPEWGIVDVGVGGSPGMGDPLERDPEMVRKDLELGVISLWSALEIWGVEASYDEVRREWVVDPLGTELRRSEIVERRRSRARPFRRWWHEERRRVLGKENVPEDVLEMLRTAMQLSTRYDQEVRDFWKLPKDFSF